MVSQRCFQSSNSRTHLAFHSSSTYPKHSRPQPSPPGLPPGCISVLPTSFHLLLLIVSGLNYCNRPLDGSLSCLLPPRPAHPPPSNHGEGFAMQPRSLPSISKSDLRVAPPPSWLSYGASMGPAICYQTRPGSPQPRMLYPTHCSRST